MSTEANRETALKFMASMSSGQTDVSLLTDDVSWWVPGRGLLTREEFFAIAGPFLEMVDGEMRLDVKGVTAEGDRVAVEAESFARLKNGKIYNNTYHFLFVFRDGKICLSKEYNDSQHVAEVLAP